MYYKATMAMALALQASAVQAFCLPIQGSVHMVPDPTCQVASHFPDVPFALGENCYQVTLKLGGFLPAYGHAGVTLEPGPVSMQDGRTVLSARSTFTMAGTRVYAAEIAVMSGDVVTEQSLITGTDGRGLLRGVTGNFNVLGNSIGKTVPVRGSLCLP